MGNEELKCLWIWFKGRTNVAKGNDGNAKKGNIQYITDFQSKLSLDVRNFEQKKICVVENILEVYLFSDMLGWSCKRAAYKNKDDGYISLDFWIGKKLGQGERSYS